MSIEEMVKLLQQAGYRVEKIKTVSFDASFLGMNSKGSVRLDSNTQSTCDDLEKLRLDAAKARNEMVTTLDPNANSRSDESYTGKSVQQLKDIAKAHKDAYEGRLEGYLG